jgi:hypothetical protein
MGNRMHADGVGKWEAELREFCGIFGFKFADSYTKSCRDKNGYRVDPDREGGTRYSVKAGRCVVSRVDDDVSWSSHTSQLQTDVPYDWDGRRRENAFRELFEGLSCAELIVRSTEPERKSPLGFTRVRLERHIVLPEFGSCAELRLKLEVLDK